MLDVGQVAGSAAIACRGRRLVGSDASRHLRAFCGAPGDVGLGGRAGAHPRDGDAVQRPVQGADPATVEPVPHSAPAAGLKWAGARVSAGRIRSHPLGARTRSGPAHHDHAQVGALTEVRPGRRQVSRSSPEGEDGRHSPSTNPTRHLMPAVTAGPSGVQPATRRKVEVHDFIDPTLGKANLLRRVRPRRITPPNDPALRQREAREC